MISRFIRKTAQMGGSAPAIGQQMAMAASHDNSHQAHQPFEERVRPLLIGIEESIQRFNDDLDASTKRLVYLSVLRSLDAVEVLMMRNIPSRAAVSPMSLSVFCEENRSSIGLTLVERGPATRALANRPTIQTLNFTTDETEKVIVAIQKAVAGHLSPDEKAVLDRRIWPKHYPDPSPSSIT